MVTQQCECASPHRAVCLKTGSEGSLDVACVLYHSKAVQWSGGQGHVDKAETGSETGGVKAAPPAPARSPLSPWAP